MKSAANMVFSVQETSFTKALSKGNTQFDIGSSKIIELMLPIILVSHLDDQQL